MKRSRFSDEGATLLEFAIVAPVIFLLMFTMIDLSLIIIGNTVGGNAAREGARVGIIDFDCADNHDGCPSPSPNYNKIVAAVDRLLGGLVRDRQAVRVRCLSPATNPSNPQEVACKKGVIRVDRDLIEVRVQWRHIGASPFVANQIHTDVARMVIVGKPDLSAPPPPPTTTTTATSVATPPPPRRTSLEMFDRDVDGRVDQVVATFDQPLPSSCATSSMWALTNTPSGGTLAGVAVSGMQATLTINEGSGPPDTAVGSFRVTFSPTGTCVAEGFNELPTDKAGPVPVSISSTNGGSLSGKMEAGDELSITFSEAVTGVPTTATVTEEDPSGSGNDTLAITNITAGTLDTGSDNYVTKNNKVASLSANVSVVSSQVTLALTGSCSGDGCGELGSGQGTFIYRPHPSMTDLVGNAAAGSFTTPSSFRLF